MPAASEFADYHDAVDFQNSRLFGHQPPSDSWGAMAQRFRLDPRRDLDANLQVIASYLRPDDVFIDVGGGQAGYLFPLRRAAGRWSLWSPHLEWALSLTPAAWTLVLATPVVCRPSGWPQTALRATWCLRAVSPTSCGTSSRSWRNSRRRLDEE